MKHLNAVTNKLLMQWERDVKAEIDYTGSSNWSDYSVYTGKSGYALLYFEAANILNSAEYLEQAFFMAEKCTMHLHKPNVKDLTFLTGAGGPLAKVCENNVILLQRFNLKVAEFVSFF